MTDEPRVAPWPARIFRNIPEPVFQYVPALDSLRSYSWSTLQADAVAGLTVAAVAVPQAMAYAQIAGIPPQYGLYTAIVMTAVGALFDSSKHLINGPTNAISIAVLSALVGFSDADRLPAAILMGLIVGAIQLGITALRLGDLNRFISHAVIVGFTLGAACLIVMDQMKNLLGLTGPGNNESYFLKRFFLTISEIGQTHFPTLMVGLATVAVALTLRWINTRFRLRIPEFLLSLIFVATAVWLLKLDENGVAVVKTIPSGLPDFQLPTVRWEWVHSLAGSGLAIAMLGLLEAVAMAKALASQSRQKLDVNQQCLSEALANLAGSCFQCYPGSGSLTRSVINKQAGALTQWSGVISALAVALTVIFLAPLAYYIPRAALAGILVISAWRLVHWKELKYYLSVTKFDAIILLATAFAAVVISVEFCVLIGVLLSFVLYVPRAARLNMAELTLSSEKVIRERIPTDPRCNRIRMFSLEGQLFFGAAPEFEQLLEEIERVHRDGVKVVVLRMKRARNPDAVCLELLDRFIERMRQHSVVVILCALQPGMMKVLDNAGILKRLGREYIFVFQETGAVWTSTLQAVTFAYELVGEDLCPHCPRRQPSDSSDDWTYSI